MGAVTGDRAGEIGNKLTAGLKFGDFRKLFKRKYAG